MIYGLKLLLPALVVAILAAISLRSAFATLLAPPEYKRAWVVIFAATVLSFLSMKPVFLMVDLAMLGLWAQSNFGGRTRDKLAVAILIVFSSPALLAPLGEVAGINQVLDLTPARTLALVLFLGLALKLASDSTFRRSRWIAAVDIFVVGYQVWRILLLIPALNATSLLRTSVEVGLDILLPYYVFSRGIRTREDLRFVLSHAALALAFAATIGIAEELTNRPIYSSLQWVYGVRWEATFNLMRGDHLRVSAMLPQPLILAFELIFALGIWSYLRGAEWRRPSAMYVLGLTLACLVFTWSRGPWLCAGAFGLCLLGLKKLPGKTFSTLLVLAILAGIGIKAAGADSVVIDALGVLFGSGAGALDTIEYRKQLLDTALALIKQSPWFGVPDYAAQMQSLKQGEGIIDIVNSYVGIALDSGVIGVALFLAPYLIIVRHLLRASRERENEGPDTLSDRQRFARAFVGLTVAALLTIFTTSMFATMPLLLTMLLAISVAGLSVAPADAGELRGATDDVFQGRRVPVLRR